MRFLVTGKNCLRENGNDCLHADVIPLFLRQELVPSALYLRIGRCQGEMDGTGNLRPHFLRRNVELFRHFCQNRFHNQYLRKNFLVRPAARKLRLCMQRGLVRILKLCLGVIPAPIIAQFKVGLCRKRDSVKKIKKIKNVIEIYLIFSYFLPDDNGEAVRTVPHCCRK